MYLLRTLFFTSTAGLVTVPFTAHSAELPTKPTVQTGYVLACTAYGDGFFYIPGTDTCLRLSGRARFEYGYQAPESRTSGTTGDYSGYRGLARINIDARTQTAYGTLRAFVRLEAASRTGFPTFASGTQLRIGNAFNSTGVDQVGRAQQYINTDKAFIQFAGLTAGRASSFFDFYAHDFELIAATAGSDISSTNLVAYTATLNKGFSVTVSVEDPTFRRTPTYAAQAATDTAPVSAPIFAGFTAGRAPSGVAFVDTVQRNRMPDFVGVLRYDEIWGSAQLSAAVHEINTGNPLAGSSIGTNLGAPLSATNHNALAHTPSAYGFAFQGGIKVNLPFIGVGDTLYLQGAYGEGAQTYTGYSIYSGTYGQSSSAIQGASFAQFFSDATLNPSTNRLELSRSFTAVASLLHYWSPEWRSAAFGSYGELAFANGGRANQGSYFGLTGTGPGAPGTRFYELSSALRDTYQFTVGASLIWSPVKNLDLGIEGIYTQYGVQSGRVLDLSKSPNQTAVYVNNGANPVRTVSREDVFQVRARIQRDF